MHDDNKLHSAKKDSGTSLCVSSTCSCVLCAVLSIPISNVSRRLWSAVMSGGRLVPGDHSDAHDSVVE